MSLRAAWMKTTIPLHQAHVRVDHFLRGEYTNKWLEQWLESQREGEPAE